MNDLPLKTQASSDRLALLRAELVRQQVDGFIVPRTDEFQGEYVAAYAERLAWLSGFTGSAGTAVVLHDAAAIFVDGRYTLQVRQQVDEGRFSVQHLADTPPARWISEHLPVGARLGFDPWLHTLNGRERLAEAVAKVGGELVALATNPIDAIWSDQPEPPLAPVEAHDLAYAGQAAAEKSAPLAAELVGKGAAAWVLTSPESLAWLFNIRGGDVPYTPVPHGFGLLHSDGRAELFFDPRKVTADLATHLGPLVSLRPIAEFAAALEALGGKRLRVDGERLPAWVADQLTAVGALLDKAADPTLLPRARKNPVELAGSRAAHRRDGVALARFFAWLNEVVAEGSVDEIDVSDRLEEFRRRGELFRDLSFPTISGSGPHGAIVHYKATEDSRRALGQGELYLVDSGAQYLDGTTDVTRTLAIGTPPDEARRAFTLVLKGHIAISSAIFPEGLAGSWLDILARRALWSAGLDYDHGTGHGVGSYLSVHEGPQSISRRAESAVLLPGMVLSNEPGYYKAGAYGIRIENLLVVQPHPAPPGAERKLLSFEILTLAPIDLRLVDLSLLDEAERIWLNAYHARIWTELSPLLVEAGDDAAREWLRGATLAV